MRNILARLFIVIFIAISVGTNAQSVKYVATNGNNNNPGTISQPWATWIYGFSQLDPGDILYIRGGTYYKANNEGAFQKNYITGTSSDSIYILNYPGETPILDLSNIQTDERADCWGLITETAYVHFKGLIIQNMYENDGNDFVNMWQLYGSHTFVERCVTRYGGGRGMYCYEGDEFYFKNCDSYMHVDSLSGSLPGNDGYGFSASIPSGKSIYYNGCRAWDCGDDGFTAGGTGFVHYDNCWSFDNGELQGGGHGYKLNGSSSESSGIQKKVTNCIAAYNKIAGATTNDDDISGYYTSGMNLYNNIFYHNGYQGNQYWGYGFVLWDSNSGQTREEDRVFRNNISYGNEKGALFKESGAYYTHTYNDWDLGGVTIYDNDFLSVDSTGIRGARQADGSLPDLNFLKLTSGSDAIDVGTNVGLPYDGSAPDLGAFEYGDSPPDGIYYVSPNGNDGNSGNYDNPWRTWARAFNATELEPGDIVYFREGVYIQDTLNLNTNWYWWPYTPGRGMKITVDGAVNNTIKFWAYPGETPILDGTNVHSHFYTYKDNTGIKGDEVNYIHLKGLHIRNFKQGSGAVDNVYQLLLEDSDNVTIENCSFYNGGGRGVTIRRSGNIDIINCDAYNNYDPYGDSGVDPGDDGYGFTLVHEVGDNIKLDGCRAWKNGNSGFYDGNNTGYTEYDNCWSFRNGKLQGAGDGFNLGWINECSMTTKRYIHNCIAVYNNAAGFNDNNSLADANSYINEKRYYNNTSYKNLHGFILYEPHNNNDDSLEYRRKYRNNIAYQNTTSPITAYDGSYYTSENNSWDNGIATITDYDFISLDSTGMSGARQSDGSLPDLNDFLELSSTSDAVDAGKYVGLSYSGNAPDIGAYESPYTGSGGGGEDDTYIIADHTIVDDYEDIPQEYIDEVKKMWLSYAGQSHSGAIRDGLVALEAIDSKYQVNVTEEGTPEAYTTSHLRASRATWGSYYSSSGWTYNYSTWSWFVQSLGISRTKAGIFYCDDNNLTLGAIGFGWCWDSEIDSPSEFGQYIYATKQYVEYCEDEEINTTPFFTTGTVDGGEDTFGETGYNKHLGYEQMRDTVKNGYSRVLFDYADILCYNNSGAVNTTSWNGHTYPIIHSDNLSGEYTGHIGMVGAIRLAKAMWWMLARIAGWDGTSSGGPEIELPSVSTIQVYNISKTKCEVSGNVYDTGGGTISAKGICYAIWSNPNIADDHTNEGAGSGQFSSVINNLIPNTTYHVRAYATNEEGTSYGSDKEFTTPKKAPGVYKGKIGLYNGVKIKW